MKPTSNAKLSIVKTLRKFVGRDTYTEIKMYCCEDMKRFVELCREHPMDIGLGIEFHEKGLMLYVGNTYEAKLMIRDGITHKVNEHFYWRFCPFCSAKIEYIEDIKDET